MHNKSLRDIIVGLNSREFSSVELTRHYLDRIQQLDSHYNSYISVCEDSALAAAAAADRQIAAGNIGKLTGVPIAHKDVFCTRGIRTSCGSKMLDNFIPPYDATIVDNCRRAGAVILGKTNMDEFAMGSSNESSFYGPSKNPWDTHAVPGGSSGGSAAAVAAQLAVAATGSDTGGSVRQPASFCGITGLKPTYGRVSRWGLVAYASSLDQAGPMARSAEDAAILLNVLAGFDPKDSTSIDKPVPDYTLALDKTMAGLRIGIPEEYFGESLDNEVAKQVQAAIKELAALGASIKTITLPHCHLAIPAYYVIAMAECSSNLSRFDGIRYGHRCSNPQNLQDLYTRSRTEGFGEEVKRRILVGTYTLSHGYYDAYYLKAQQVRRLIKQDFDEAFSEVDMIAGPTAPSVAFARGDRVRDPVSMYLQDIYTIANNLTGLPGISIPCGFSDNKPIGLQLTGRYFGEQQLLSVAHQFQCHTDFHRRRPPAHGQSS